MKMGQDDGTSQVYDITVSVKVREDSADWYWAGNGAALPGSMKSRDGSSSRGTTTSWERGMGNGGFGGRRFDIEFFDGRRVTTHDLWSQGTIPPKHRERYQDNARFAPQPERSRFTAFDLLMEED
ncbi:putative protein OS=Streptomyces microflavus OX=1919 GN=Smic_80960 PE=4 SV=1 [Streptomyces microflavus]